MQEGNTTPMSDYTLEDLFQCSLEEYCDYVGTTPDELIEKKYKKIELLDRAYEKILEKRSRMDMALMAKAISEKIHSERKAISKLEKWRRKS